MNQKTTAKETVRLIRGSALEVLVPGNSGRGLPFDEAFRVAEQGRKVIASNARMNKAIMRSDEWRTISEVAFICWTGTMTGYMEPGKKLEETIEYIDPETNLKWIFPVPEQFRGMRDAILVAEHPDYALESDGGNLLVRTGAVDIVENFPARNECWHLVDAKHGIPQGSEVDGKNANARFLYRIASRVGPTWRAYDSNYRWDCHYRRDVNIEDMPSKKFGMVVEAPE